MRCKNYLIMSLILTLLFSNLSFASEELFINQATFGALSETYQSQTKEFAVCLYGEGNQIYDYSIQESIISGENTLLIQKCQSIKGLDESNYLSRLLGVLKNYLSGNKAVLIGMAHNHPNGVCAMSQDDMYSFGYTQLQYSGIMCGTNLIKIYTPNDLITGFEVTIN